jgi:hypothetical protein
MQTLPNLTQEVVTFQKSRPSLLQIGFQCISRQLYMKLTVHLNGTRSARTKTALQAVISPSSIFQLASSTHCVFIHSHKKIFGARFKRSIVSFLITFLKLSESVIAKSSSVGVSQKYSRELIIRCKSVHGKPNLDHQVFNSFKNSEGSSCQSHADNVQYQQMAQHLFSLLTFCTKYKIFRYMSFPAQERRAL